MNIDWLNTYLDLMQTRNFNASAERLGLTQSTVSHRIQKLEASLDQTLFRRGRSGAVPTDAGLRFQSHARNLVREWQRARRTVGRTGDINSELRIGLQYDIARSHAGSIVHALRKEFPDTSIYVEVDYSQQMTLDVDRGELDAALIFTPRYLPGLYYREIALLDYLMVSRRRATLAEITRADYVFPNITPPFAAEHRQLLPELDDCLLACGHTDALAQFLLSLGGASYLAAEVARQLVADGVLYRVEDAPVLTQQAFFNCHVKQSRQSTQLKVLRALQTLFMNY